ncbi:hypothetical protein SAMN05216374_4231 [Tardiphaga sp. OK246]|nr:hypothetical protein SAMN05216374_4231 [Tardiphaga sp. OK246]
MESTGEKRRFPPPWTVECTGDTFRVKDANGVVLANVYSRDDLIKMKWDNYTSNLSSDEARRIALAISRIPTFMNHEPRFPERRNAEGPSTHWRRSHPYHVALQDAYVQENYDDIVECCQFNRVPLDATGEILDRGGVRWRTYCFARQFDAIRFWDKFNGSWMLGMQFVYPARPENFPAMKSVNRKGAL